MIRDSMIACPLSLVKKTFFMKYSFCLILILIFHVEGHTQPTKTIALSFGRTAFGTGDILGPGLTTEFSKRLAKKEKSFFSKFCLGGELKFETGATQPKVINPSLNEFFFGVIFRQTTDLVVTAKASYFPFSKTFLKGINISVGPSIGYTYQSREFRAILIYDSLFLDNVRRSYLEYNNAVLVGYRVSAGYEYLVNKHLLAGIRMDLDSYSNGDINTLVAAKIGYSF